MHFFFRRQIWSRRLSLKTSFNTFCVLEKKLWYFLMVILMCKLEENLKYSNICLKIRFRRSTIRDKILFIYFPFIYHNLYPEMYFMTVFIFSSNAFYIFFILYVYITAGKL